VKEKKCSYMELGESTRDNRGNRNGGTIKTGKGDIRERPEVVKPVDKGTRVYGESHSGDLAGVCHDGQKKEGVAAEKDTGNGHRLRALKTDMRRRRERLIMKKRTAHVGFLLKDQNSLLRNIVKDPKEKIEL